VTALLLAAAFAGCGADRAAVKNLLDHPALLPPRVATVEQLLALRAPRWARSAPRRQIERQVVQLDVEVLAFKTEADGDIHAIIRSAGAAPGKGPGAAGFGRLMVAEFPLPGCARGSPYALRMARARASLLRLVNAHVSRMRLTGVVFFDRVHGQTGGAPNGVELHPVLAVEALP
jgi:hypothetical protein